MSDLGELVVRFNTRYLIRFSHCDPAGIVFFPQYLILTNQLVEDWFNTSLGISFAELHIARRIGTPLVRLECDFLRPSRMGDLLDFSLQLTRLSQRSLTVEILAQCAGEIRLRSKQVMVTISLESGQSINVPADLARALKGAEITNA